MTLENQKVVFLHPSVPFIVGLSSPLHDVWLMHYIATSNEFSLLSNDFPSNECKGKNSLDKGENALDKAVSPRKCLIQRIFTLVQRFCTDSLDKRKKLLDKAFFRESGLSNEFFPLDSLDGISLDKGKNSLDKAFFRESALSNDFFPLSNECFPLSNEFH